MPPLVSLRCRALWDAGGRPAAPEAFLARLAEEARAVRDLGAGALEFPGDLVAADPRYQDPGLWGRAAGVLAAAGLQSTIHLPFVWADLCALDRAVWEGSVRSAEAALTACRPLEPLMAAVHPGNYGSRALLEGAAPAQRPQLLALLGNQLVQALARLKRAPGGGAVALENLEGIPWPLQLQAANAADVAVCLDVGHCVSSGTDPALAAREAAARLGGLHLHDAVPPAAGERTGRTHLPLGQGVLDAGRLARQLRELHFEGPIVVEVADDDRAAETARRWLALHAAAGEA